MPRTASRTATAASEAEVAWSPHPGSQTIFLACPYREALYTGTRGPGKTDALIMDFAQHVGQGYRDAWRGVLFRHEYKPLEEVVTKTKRWFHKIFPDARFLASQSSYKWVFPEGEELLLRAFKKPGDYWDYHGMEFPWIGWEELTSWPDLECYHLMKSCNRSSHSDVPRKVRATCNPYGPGHNAVKNYFIDQAPQGQPFEPDTSAAREALAEIGVEETVKKGERLKAVHIHGHYSENRALMESQPDYPASIAQAARNPEQAKAWLSDDWDIVAGGMFDDVWDRSVHVLDGWAPSETPEHWRIDRAFDWGGSAPFSVGWWAQSDGTEAPDGHTYPRGTLFRIAEWYGWNGTPNEGLRLTDKEIAEGIAEREREMGIAGRVQAGPADPSIFNDEYSGQGTQYQRMKQAAGVRFVRADNTRQAGWQQMRQMLDESLKRKPDREGRPEGPCLYVFETCRQFIRTVPTLPRSDKNPDDADTDAEDHVADETRYRVMAPDRSAEVSSFKV